MNRLMKTTLFALLISTGYCYAQPMIQNIVPSPNYSANRYISTQVPGPGNAGNGTWDFSFYPFTAFGKHEYVPVSGSKFEGDFPGANLVYRLRYAGDTTWNYYRSTNDSIAVLAENMNAQNGQSDYTPNRKLLFSFPFNYGDSLYDTWQSFIASGNVTRKYDGYGTLITPYGSFNDVARIKSVTTVTSTTSTPTTVYTWYTVNPLIPVAEYNVNNGQMTVLYVFNTSVENVGSDGTISEVSPNPFGSHAILHINKPVKGMELSIMNTLGQVVRRMPVTGAATTIERNELAPGLYFYKVQSPGGTVTGGKFVIE